MSRVTDSVSEKGPLVASDSPVCPKDPKPPLPGGSEAVRSDLGKYFHVTYRETGT